MAKDNVFEPTREVKDKNAFSRLAMTVVGGIGKGIRKLAVGFSCLLPRGARNRLSGLGKKLGIAFSSALFSGVKAGISSVLAGIALCAVSSLMAPGVIGGLFIAAGVGFILVGLGKGIYSYVERRKLDSVGSASRAENLREVVLPERGRRHRRRRHHSNRRCRRERCYSSKDYVDISHGGGWRNASEVQSKAHSCRDVKRRRHMEQGGNKKGNRDGMQCRSRTR